MVFKFEVGEPVILVGNTNNDAHRVGWMRGMDQMRGDIFHIARCIPRDNGGHNEYTLQEDHERWFYDEEWLAPAAQKEVDTAELDAFFNEF